MPSPRDPDLRLERLGGPRPDHLGESAKIATSVAGATGARDSRAAYEALIDAVFTAHGAVEWLFGLRKAMAALLADKDDTPAARDAIRAATPR